MKEAKTLDLPDKEEVSQETLIIPKMTNKADTIITLVEVIHTLAMQEISKRNGGRIAIHHFATDQNQDLEGGSTAKYIKEAAQLADFDVVTQGQEKTLLKRKDLSPKSHSSHVFG